jgi:hypothetical protein
MRGEEGEKLLSAGIEKVIYRDVKVTSENIFVRSGKSRGQESLNTCVLEL